MPEKKKKVFIRTFGCQMNEYDSLKLTKLLEDRYEEVGEPGLADLILVNTCSVRAKPENKVYSLLGEMRSLKESNPGLLIGVGGCVAQQEGARIVERSPEVDFVFGTHNLSLVPSLIELRQQGKEPQVAVDYRDEWEELPLGFSEGSMASVFVSISRGCNKNCTYCVVPRTRGREVSRPFSEIEREIRIAVHRGVKEVVLLGQTVNSYGRDLSPRISFVELLERISEIEGLKRIRFTSPHPQEIREDFVDCISANEKICRHVHMPLQSGSDRVLKAMNRNYRTKRYLEIIDALKSAVPDIAVTTDIIVGFPGEDEQDFEKTLEIMKTVQFDNSYSFVFSARPNTPAADLDDPVPFKRKLERLKVLQQLQEKIAAERLLQWVGKEVEILIDGYSRSDSECMKGRTSQNILVNLEKPYPGLKQGDLVNSSVSGVSRFTLRGKLSSNAQEGESGADLKL